MAWRLAHSLEVLRNEVRQLHPGTTVWTIGDAAHRGTASDHHPNPAGVVCAVDVLGDAGLDLAAFAEHVRSSGHRAAKYVIYNRRIASAARGWTWRRYSGSNPHTGHVHVSVGVGPDGRSTGNYDDRSPWGLLEGDDDMQLSDRMDVPDWVMQDWPDIGGRNPGTMTVETALTSGYGHSRLGQVRTRELLAGQAAILAAVTGQDQATAVRTVMREEFARLGPALAEQLADVPAEQVEAALREVLGSLDEPEPA